jgi:cell division protein FtsZ
MGSGFGEGENRAQEAAQEAISSPLLDDISIAGARGVLINITGGMDLAIDEVTAISSIIQEEAGDEAEIIFGAVHDPSLEGKVRVTVIATGFDQAEDEKVISGSFLRARAPRTARPAATAKPAATPQASTSSEEVEAQRRAPARVAVGGGASEEVVPLNRFPERTIARSQISGLDIPTFIRRQMD